MNTNNNFITRVVTLFKKKHRNVSISLLGNIIFSILGFLSMAILARALSLRDFGYWTIYLTASTLLEMMRSGFLHTAMVKFCSGNSVQEQKGYIGSGWILGIIFTLLSTTLVLLGGLFVSAKESSYSLFFNYYPLLAFVSLPFSISTSLLQYRFEIEKLVLIKTVNMVLTLALFGLTFIYKFELNAMILLHIACNAATSLFAIGLKWSGLENIKLASAAKMKEISHFGKYTFGTLIGTNLLKSSDTFIIGATLGSEKAALYSIPLKLTEVFEVPLRSFVSVTLPKMAAFATKRNITEVKRIFQSQSGMLSIAYIPLMILCFLFAEYIVSLFGGSSYASIDSVFQVFCFYGLLLPIDRFSGITLDCLNLPQFNFIKVLIMVSFNIAFDLTAVSFSNDLRWIALGTVLTTILGIASGMFFLRRAMPTNINSIVVSGVKTIHTLRIHLKLHQNAA